MESKILKLLGQADYAPSNVPELIDLLRLKPGQQQELQGVLEGLVKQGLIIRTKGNRYIESRDADLVPGIIQITRGGRGFVQPDESGIGEISIAESATSTALHGDRVLVRRDNKPTGLRKGVPESNAGAVVRVLERKRTQFVGTLQRSKQFLYVIPDDPRIPHNIYVPEPRDVGRQVNMGDKVVVEITAWENRQTPPEGEVIEVLGAPDAEGVDMLSVLRHYALPLHFPKEVLAEANTIAKSRPDNQPSAEESAERVDCRGHNVITIDPDDARDFDDAICIQPAGGGKWKVWVHIADVSHYVRPGSPLDVEAKKRGNSTYLVDRVIPMLPEKLSNGLCSLNPEVERLCMVCDMLVTAKGEVHAYQFYPAVMFSHARFTYTEVAAILANTRGPEASKRKDRVKDLLNLHDVYRALLIARQARGAVDFETTETQIVCDENGRIEKIVPRTRNGAHKLIEEAMLAANVCSADFIAQGGQPGLFRVHEGPTPEKQEILRNYLKAMAVGMTIGD
ncbi:MAG TPA: ribonuclease R, partial [Verrucomicrobiales bacterium]|nr:ribonuclease R [Verrucomicrobiales bacterium]